MFLSSFFAVAATLSEVVNNTSIATGNASGDMDIYIILIFVIVLLAFAVILYYFKFYKRSGEDKSTDFGKALSSGLIGSNKDKFKLTFKVVDENKKAINDAFLLLQKENGDIEFSNKIPSTVTIPNLDEGKYNIKIVKDRYAAINRTLNLKTDMNFDASLNSEKTKTFAEDAKGPIKGITENMLIVEIFVRTPSGIPLNNAKILIGGQKSKQEVNTNSEGMCTLTIPNGEYLLSIEKDLCESQTKHITIIRDEKFEINLIPTAKITPEQRNKLQLAYCMVLNAYNEIHSGYERTIPKYFVKVAEKIVREIEKQAENVNFNSNEEYDRAMNDYIRAAEISMNILAVGMLENRNVLLYAKLSQYEKEISPPVLPDVEKISISDAYRILSEVDNVLIYEIRNISTYPVAVLWKTAKTLLNEPNEASAHIGGIFLKAAEFMLKNDELRKRLKITIL
ncbi:MAG: carboxypeptidase-like regulatory domain-containing protein [Candidatus Altarchaeum sp.]|nr:carboxypeptidase-like regulatory domain-containing protein [Candidatus Altarchaeum sp.]